MTSVSFTRRLALLATLASGLVLAACGGNDNGGGGSASIRALNLTADIPSIDLYTSETKQFSALATDTVSGSVALDANTYTLNVKKAGDGTTLFTGSYSLAKDKHYTAVIWGREAALRLQTLPEDEDTSAIDSANARIRFLNATIGTGSLDVYLTEATTALGDSQPVQSALTAGTLGGFRDVTAKSYRLRVTGSGAPQDLRLDIPSITLSSKTYNTLALTAGGSGVLVNGTLITQQGAVTSARNTQARVRMIASVNGGATVAATVGGATLAGGLRSPSVGPYTLVNAGSAVDLTVRVGGNVVSTGNRSFVAGTDYTVLAYGPDPAGGTTPTVRIFTDDNRLPTNATDMKVRLLNGVSGSDPATLQLDLAVVASDVAAGTASNYFTLAADSSVQVDVTTLSGSGALYSTTDVNLQAQGVYTVFLLGGNTAPTGVIRKER